AFAPALRGRSLCIIARNQPADGLFAWLRSNSDSISTSVGVLLGTEEVPGVDGLALGRIDPCRLLEAIRPVCARKRPSIVRAAHRADGRPGAFARAIWSADRLSRFHAEPRKTTRGLGSRVAERLAVYGVDDSPGAALDPDVQRSHTPSTP